MASRSPIRVSARAGESFSRLAPPPRTRSGSEAGGCSGDTLHCSSDVAGSAVQFNSSVSAMPSHLSRTFATPAHPGTADTLLLRWTALRHMTRTTSILILLVVLTGCVQNPDEQPATSDLVGTWVLTSHTARPPTQFLRLNPDHTFAATNFPVSPAFGKTANESGAGTWQLESKYAAWHVRLPLL
jgi:hypothetical protein